MDIKDLHDTLVSTLGDFRTYVDTKIGALSTRLDTIQAKSERPPDPMDTNTRRGKSDGITNINGIKLLKPTARLSDVVDHQLPAGIKASDLDFGRWLKGVITGDWTGAELERKTMSTGSDTLGGYLMPSPLSTLFIDLARNQSVCLQAGATTIPMTTGTLDIARLTSDPTGYWKQENAAGTFSDITVGRTVLSAHTLIGLCKASVELIEDAKNSGSVIQNALTAALALELDRACVRGNGIAAEPLGLRNWSSLGLNYGAQLIDKVGLGLDAYDDFCNAVQLIAQANGPGAEALSTILAPRDAGTLDRLRDGEDRPYQPPPSWNAMKHLTTNSIPSTLYSGNKSEAYVGDFSQLAVGMRTGINIEITRVGGDGDSGAFRNLQVWIRAYLRADLVLLRPSWFVVIDAIAPPA